MRSYVASTTRASDGTVVAVSDEEAIRGSLAIARSDGLYLEPSSRVVLPALERLGLPEGTRVVALACGNGFRETFVMQSAHALRRERTKISDLDRFLEENTT